MALRHSDAPAIDENEVVEQAAAFLGPDLTHYFPKYGPLTMYVLSGIYRVAAWLHGQTNLEYASRVFFEGAEHYAIARVYTYSWLSVLALTAFFVLKRQLGNAPALLACTLLSFPFLEILLDGARIDTPQAAFQGLALLALTEVVSPRVGAGGQATPRLQYWLAAGCCAGLAFATKPLPGLLIAPAFLVAGWFAAQPIFPRSANRNRRWVTDGLVKRAREKRQKYIIIAGHRRNDVRELGYRWFDEAKLEAQFGRVAIFSVPDEPTASSAPKSSNPLGASAAAHGPDERSAPVR
jgi:hypothetical protein